MNEWLNEQLVGMLRNSDMNWQDISGLIGNACRICEHRCDVGGLVATLMAGMLISVQLAH